MTRGFVSATYALVFRDSTEELAGLGVEAVERAGEAETSETIARYSKGRIFADPVNAHHLTVAIHPDILAVLPDAVSHTVLWGVAVQAPWVELGHLC